MKPKHLITYRVYYEDTDAGGVVYYANYLKFAERARTDMLRSLNIRQSELMHEEGIAFVVRHVEADLRKPARLDDLITIETHVDSIAGASLTMHQHITLEGESLVHVKVKVACVALPAMKAVRLPASLKNTLSQYAV